MSASPIVIGHRGASGYMPEHTLASYFLAMQFGADYIEPDLVMTRDAVLVARHENEIGGTTDVAAHPQFAERHTERSVDGRLLSGWFTEDFTLAELKTLRAVERIPRERPANARFDGHFEVPTFAEILALVRAMDEQRATRARELGLPAPAPIGVYPETKHPSHFAARGLEFEAPLLATLERYGYRGHDAPVWLQSFEVGNLKALARVTGLRRVQLIESEGAPYDQSLADGGHSYAELITPQGLGEIARYAQGIGPNKSLVIPRTGEARLGRPTSLVADAHAAGLVVHPWTFRAENAFLPSEFQRGTVSCEYGDLPGELLAYLRTGIDGFFTDQADLGVAARDAFLVRHA